MTVIAWTKRLCKCLPAVAPALAILLGLQGAALAGDPLEDTVKARQGYYKLILHNAGTLFGMAKGDIEYDAERASTAANNLLTLSKLNVGSLYPAGTSKEEMPGKTRALKKIWDDFPGVGEKAKAWKAAVADMAAVAGDGVDAVRAKAGPLGGGCKGCHENYRADDF